MKNTLSIVGIIVFCLFAVSCKKQSYKAYKDKYKLSSKGGYYGKSGPFKLYTKNAQYYMESIPYVHINVIPGDLCAGITQVKNTGNDSVLYSINRYFGLDNTFISANGKSIAYVNNYWRGTDYDSCSTSILEIYHEGKLLREYSYKGLLKQEPNDEYTWLFGDTKKNAVLAKNNNYAIGDTLYLIPTKTGTVLEIDLTNAEVLNEIDTTIYLGNLVQIGYTPPKVDFIRIEEKEGLPRLKNGNTFRNGLTESLNVKLISTNETHKKGRYYFRFELKCKIDKSGMASEIRVSSNEHVLTDISDDFISEIKSFIATQTFYIEELPYHLDFWQFQDRFYISRNPINLAQQDLKNYNVKVCKMDSLYDIYIPTDVQDAHNELDKMLSATDKIRIKNGESSHFGLGMWIRNNWGLWAGGRLKCFFKERDLYHPDSISSLIISTYQMKLNDKIPNIDSLIRAYSRSEKEWMENLKHN